MFYIYLNSSGPPLILLLKILLYFQILKYPTRMNLKAIAI